MTSKYRFSNSELTQKLVNGVESLTRLREEDIQIGVTPKEEVYREDKVVLYRFVPKVEHSLNIPILIVYALVNRPYIVDLQEGRSLVANLLNLGLDVYLIDWGYPSRGDRWLTLDDYINGYINNCVDVVRDRHNLEQINLLGICQGGAFSLCYSSLYPEKVKNLITMVTPGKKRVDLGNIRIPILNIYAEQDHLVPPASSLALETYIGSDDYTLRSFPVGHIGMYVSSKVQRNLPPTIVDWLKVRA